jgi:vanillate O-demethylase ferredoxin subunit
MASSATWTTAVVRSAAEVADGVRLLELVPKTGARPYPTGSHLDVGVSIRGLPEVRSYSLVGDRPLDGAYRVAVRHVANSRGGSRAMWELQPGAVLEVSEPTSHFELRFDGQEIVLIAAGIGITPMVGMAEALARRGTPPRLLYAGRSRATMPFVDELAELLADHLELLVGDEGRRLDVAAEVARLADTGEIYLCGPMGLMDDAREAWRASGRPGGGLRIETFGSGGRFASEPFSVVLPGYDNATVTVGEDETMLDALRLAGVDVMFDCLRGECGLCTVDILEVEGQLDHRDVFLSPQQREEGRKMCTCVSRAVGGALVVDTGYRAAGGS